MENHRDSFLRSAAECKLISELANDEAKRELFAKLAEHQRIVAAEVERAIADQLGSGELSSGK